MASLIDPTSAGFLLSESRMMPMHVGGMQLFKRPADAGPGYGREVYEWAAGAGEIAPLFLKHPSRSVRTGGQYVWESDREFDIEHHVRHSALPEPGRIRELLELVGRLHSTRMDPTRPMWEAHVIEGLNDGRLAMYTKLHHSLVDGVAAMRLLAAVLTTDAELRGMAPPWAPRETSGRRAREASKALALPDVTEVALAMSQGLALAQEAAGLPVAVARTLTRGVLNQTSPVSLYAPRTILNRNITGARRFAAQDWPVERLRAIGKATGTTLNDVVMAMCSGAMRTFLMELDALPEQTLVAMVPVSFKARQSAVASAEGGNSLGSLMVALGTHLADPKDRLESVHRSMVQGKEALGEMTPLQVTAMSGLGQAPAIALPFLGLSGIVRPPYNLVISNVPGPREVQYLNGAELLGTYPLSIPIHGMALNITCNSYAGKLCFGLTGCRRTVPHLQRLLTHLGDEVAALEEAAGL